MAEHSPPQETRYGGQAVIEGVMIRSPRFVSLACRLPQPDGSYGVDTPIDIQTEEIRSLLVRYPWLRKVPLLRGFAALIEMLGMGLRALERSGNLQVATLLLTPLAGALATDGGEPEEGAGALNGPLLWTTIGVAFLMGIGLFVVLPNWLADVIGRWLGGRHPQLLNAIEGLLRLLIFVAYVGGIGLMDGVRRVFMYHGAEHRVVNGLEAGCPLTVAGVEGMSVIHPRCGTNFAFIVIVLSLLMFAFLPWTPSVLPRVGMRLLLLPLVAGIGFELIRFVGARRDQRWLLSLIAPGLWLQKLTTREPAPDMVEVALASLLAVKQAEEGGDLLCEVRGDRPAVETPVE